MRGSGLPAVGVLRAARERAPLYTYDFRDAFRWLFLGCLLRDLGRPSSSQHSLESEIGKSVGTGQCAADSALSNNRTKWKRCDFNLWNKFMAAVSLMNRSQLRSTKTNTRAYQKRETSKMHVFAYYFRKRLVA